MALIKQMENAAGIQFEYHRIDLIKINPTTITVSLAQYKDASARQANKQPVRIQALSFSKETLDLSQPLLAEIYTKIKGLQAFSGAQDA